MKLFSRNTTSTYKDYKLITEHDFIIKQLRVVDGIIHGFALYWFYKYIIRESKGLITCICLILFN